MNKKKRQQKLKLCVKSMSAYLWLVFAALCSGIVDNETAVDKFWDLIFEPIRLNEQCVKTPLSEHAIAVLRSIRVIRGWPKPRIFCVVYTVSKYHTTRALAVKNTWARRCDEFVFASDKLDLSLPAINVQYDSNDTYESLWQKTRAVGVWLNNQKILERFDWVLRADDDTYVIVDNLKFFLSSPEITRFQPRYHKLLIGHVFDRSHINNWFVAGSAYVLSSAAVSNFAATVVARRCSPTLKAAEDVQISECFKKEYNMIPLDTRDQNDKQRFHMLSADGSATLHNWNHSNSWVHDYHNTVRSGLDCCSDRSVSFHYVAPHEMEQYDKILYECRTPKRETF